MNELEMIIKILQEGDESGSYIDAVKFLHKMMLEAKEEGTFDKDTYFSSAISIHNKLRNKYNQDFNGELLRKYRLFIGLYEDKE